MRVLFVAEDADLAHVVAERCARGGIAVHVLDTAEAALAELERLRPDLVLSNITLRGMDGLAMCRALRERSSVPVMIVGGRHDPELAARALDDGADDVLPTPFDGHELLARIRAHVRRARGEVVHTEERVLAGALAIDFTRRAVELGGTPVALTSTEFAVIAALARHPGRALTREDLLRLVHGTDDGAFDRSIDVIVSRLRGKLEADPRRPEVIKTVRGVGYMLMISGAQRAPSPRMATTESAPESP